MLFGTYQPLFRANANPKFERAKNDILQAMNTPITPQDFRGTEPEPLETLIGYRPIWCFPARNLQEALTHSLLTAPNVSDLFFLIESDDFIRIDKAKHYVAIRHDVDTVQGVKDSISPDCPDDQSEFLLPVESLETAKLMAFTASGADPANGSTLIPMLVANGEGQYIKVGLPDEPYVAWQHLIAPAQTLFNYMENGRMHSPDADEEEMRVKAIQEAMRLRFMFFVLPAIYEGMPTGLKQLTFGPMFLLQHNVKQLLDCYNAMARWSFGDCQEAGYAKIFQDAWLHADTPDAIASYLSCHDYKLPERNEKCPCGSGKKFKKCHGKILM